MSRKPNLWWYEDAVKLESQGRTPGDILASVRRRSGPGRAAPGKSTVYDRVKEIRESRLAARAESPAEPDAPPPSLPALSVPPLDSGDDLAGADLLAWIGRGIRQAQADADACRAADDLPGAGRAMKLAAQLAQLLAKERARMGEDSETVRVKASDIAAAAERARAKLHDLAARLAAERGR